MAALRHNAATFRRLAASIPGLEVVGGAAAEASPLVHLALSPAPPHEEVSQQAGWEAPCASACNAQLFAACCGRLCA